MYYEPTNSVGCFTGGLLAADQTTDGCMTAQDIKLTADSSDALSLTGIPDKATKRNLQGFSTAAHEKMAGQVYYNMYNAYYRDTTLPGN